MKELENSILKRYRKDIWSKFMKACKEYDLIQEGDRIAVCISGGKDSMLLAKCFDLLARFSKIPFTVKFLVMDPGYKKENLQKIHKNAEKLGLDIHVFTSQIFEIVEKVDKNPCYLCARMRRGSLYSYAQELDCNKIALGHHYDDVIETTLMNLFYAGEIRTMMPKLHSQNFKGVELIRPLFLVREESIIRWMKHNDLDFLQCACRFTEDLAQDAEHTTSKRQEIKAFIKESKKHNLFFEQNIFKSMSNVNLDKVMAYYSDQGKVNFLDDYYPKDDE